MDAIPQRESRSLVVTLAAMLLVPAGLGAQEMLGVPLNGSGHASADVAADEAPADPVRTFRARQLAFPRVQRAYEARSVAVARLFAERGVSNPAEVFFRVFKREQLLEVWARDADAAPFLLLDTYPVCGTSGELGPKREKGDEQIPEGFYHIDLFNPESQFHLSLRVDYPNAVDRARGSSGPLGGDIFIHGGCATIGCVPITDEWIEEVYLIAMTARDAGQDRIPVHMFPARLDDDGFAWLVDTYGTDHPEYEFWTDLRQGFLAFERGRIVPDIDQHRGRYIVPRGVAAPQ